MGPIIGIPPPPRVQIEEVKSSNHPGVSNQLISACHPFSNGLGVHFPNPFRISLENSVQFKEVLGGRCKFQPQSAQSMSSSPPQNSGRPDAERRDGRDRQGHQFLPSTGDRYVHYRNVTHVDYTCEYDFE